MSRSPSTTAPLTKADLTEAIGQVLEVVKDARSHLQRQMQDVRSDLQGQMQDVRSDLQGQMQDVRSDLQGQIQDTRNHLEAQIRDTRNHLEEKIAWARQDAKEQLESVTGGLRQQIGGVEQRLELTQTAVLALGRDMKEVKATLSDHGQKLEHVIEKVDQHDRDIAALQEARLPV